MRRKSQRHKNGDFEMSKETRARTRHQPNSMRDAAVAYARAGWPIFPCRVGDKRPAIKHGVTEATTDPKKIEAWWDENPDYNIAFHPGGADQMVIDYDVGAAEGFPIEGMTHTGLVALTPSGGSHEYYALAEGERANNSASKIGPKIDVRGFNGYVLVPPSQVNDKPYEWDCATNKDGLPTAKAAYRCDELIAETRKETEKHKDRDVWIIEPDLPENIKLAIDWLEGKPFKDKIRDIAIDGQGGDDTLYRTATMVRSFGLEAAAPDILLKHYNPLCTPECPAAPAAEPRPCGIPRPRIGRLPDRPGWPQPLLYRQLLSYSAPDRQGRQLRR
jgi:hypothetical protein